MIKPQSDQAGLVLPLVLIFLVIMMLLGTAVIRNVTLDEKMAGNMRNRSLAFQAAERALRYCESSVQLGTTTSLGLKVNQEGPVAAGPNAGKNYWEINSFWNDVNYAISLPVSPGETATSAAVLAQQPKCMVEIITAPISRSYTTAQIDRDTGSQKTQFRITARGTGLDDHTVVQLQSYLIM